MTLQHNPATVRAKARIQTLAFVRMFSTQIAASDVVSCHIANTAGHDQVQLAWHSALRYLLTVCKVRCNLPACWQSLAQHKRCQEEYARCRLNVLLLTQKNGWSQLPPCKLTLHQQEEKLDGAGMLNSQS